MEMEPKESVAEEACKSIYKTQAMQLKSRNLLYFGMLIHLFSLLSVNKRQLKFVFSKKATKIDEIFTGDLTLTT